MSDTCVAFDLDDTLYKEIDFLESGFRYIANRLCVSPSDAQGLLTEMLQYRKNGLDVFKHLNNRFGNKVKISDLLNWYRCHIPDIKLPSNSLKVLQYLKRNDIETGLITDGRSITQRNKIVALGILDYIDERHIIISEEFGSEKPSLRNFQYFENLHPDVKDFFYIADNPAKDFIAPKTLGWKSIGLLDDGRNIHKHMYQHNDVQPDIWVKDITEILTYID